MNDVCKSTINNIYKFYVPISNSYRLLEADFRKEVRGLEGLWDFVLGLFSIFAPPIFLNHPCCKSFEFQR